MGHHPFINMLIFIIISLMVTFAEGNNPKINLVLRYNKPALERGFHNSTQEAHREIETIASDVNRIFSKGIGYSVVLNKSESLIPPKDDFDFEKSSAMSEYHDHLKKEIRELPDHVYIMLDGDWFHKYYTIPGSACNRTSYWLIVKLFEWSDPVLDRKYTIGNIIRGMLYLFEIEEKTDESCSCWDIGSADCIFKEEGGEKFPPCVKRLIQEKSDNGSLACLIPKSSQDDDEVSGTWEIVGLVILVVMAVGIIFLSLCAIITRS
jgi:hypothetical protein